jgi:hypothetical protein
METAFDEISYFTDKLLFARGYDADDDDDKFVDQVLISEAEDVAKEAEVVLLFVGLPEIMEAEGFDRANIRMPAQHAALLNAISQVNSNIVLILTNGGAIQLPATYNAAKAILEGYLLGQAGGGAMADIIFGVQSPCGKLAETMPIVMEDILADTFFPGARDAVEHREGLDIGYRYFDTANLPVRFPFGHGLSYTTFDYSNLINRVTRDESTVKTIGISFEIKNVGSYTGSEVVQLYVHAIESSVYRPIHELKAFKKVLLEKGETVTINFTLTEEAFAFYDIGTKDWVVEPGAFDIQVGASSRDIRLCTRVRFSTGVQASLLARESYPPRENATPLVIDDVVFARRFGAETETMLQALLLSTESTNDSSDGMIHRNSLLKEVARRSVIGKLFLHIVFYEASKDVKPGPTEARQKRMVKAVVGNIPLRALVLFSKGGLSFHNLDGIIALMNASPCVALRFFCRASKYAIADTLASISGRHNQRI